MFIYSITTEKKFNYELEELLKKYAQNREGLTAYLTNESEHNMGRFRLSISKLSLKNTGLKAGLNKIINDKGMIANFEEDNFEAGYNKACVKHEEIAETVLKENK